MYSRGFLQAQSTKCSRRVLLPSSSVRNPHSTAKRITLSPPKVYFRKQAATSGRSTQSDTTSRLSASHHCHQTEHGEADEVVYSRQHDNDSQYTATGNSTYAQFNTGLGHDEQRNRQSSTAHVDRHHTQNPTSRINNFGRAFLVDGEKTLHHVISDIKDVRSYLSDAQTDCRTDAMESKGGSITFAVLVGYMVWLLYWRW